LSIKNKSHAVTAEITVPDGGAKGVIISQGANIGGWSLYFKDGKLKYCYNWGGFENYFVESAKVIPPGDHQIRMEFTYAGGGLGKGGTAELFVDGTSVGKGNVDNTLAIVFSADDGLDVGEDSGAPVSPDYGWKDNSFNGTIKGVVLQIGEGVENSDHMVTPEQVLAAAMGRQ
jgi:arylsulfatase